MPNTSHDTATDPRLRPLSLAERDRRWSAVRAAMDARGLDALIVRGTSAKWDSGMANVRYLTQIGGNGEEAIVVFLRDAEPAVFIFAGSQCDFWRGAQNWVHDVRPFANDWGARAREVIGQHGLMRSRVGVVGIGGRYAAGSALSHDVYQSLTRELPQVVLEPASDIVESARLIKSEEEIVRLRAASRLCEVAAAAMVGAARPGIAASVAYGEIMGALLGAGGEAPMYMLYEAADQVRHPLRFPPDRELRSGDVALHELSTKYGGYWSHFAMPVSIGPPRRIYEELSAAAVAGYFAALGAIKPGSPLADVSSALIAPIEAAHFTAAKPRWKGLGLEQVEHPIDGMSAEVTTLQPGMVFGLQVTAKTQDLQHAVMIGDAVVVTETGGARLANVPIGLQQGAVT